jgi:hypothetical protein
MICLNCHKQIPDDSSACPFCGKEVFAEEQLPREIGYRRYQRWFFYLIIILVFIGMIGMIVKTYSENTRYIEANANNMAALKDLQAKLGNTQKNLDEKNADLANKTGELERTLADLVAKEKLNAETSAALKLERDKLASSTAEFKKVLDEKVELAQNLDRYQLDMDDTNANIYGLIIKLGQGITNKDLAKIPVAETNLGGEPDADRDGLSDMVESALGSNPKKADTDGDGFNDKAELLKGFNYLGSGQLGVDNGFASKQKGKILLQVQAHGEAWYVSPDDGKKYFLGKPSEAFKTMSSLGFLKIK